MVRGRGSWREPSSSRLRLGGLGYYAFGHHGLKLRSLTSFAGKAPKAVRALPLALPAPAGRSHRKPLTRFKSPQPCPINAKRPAIADLFTFLVRGGGLEPPRISPYAPQTYVSTNSTTCAIWRASRVTRNKAQSARCPPPLTFSKALYSCYVSRPYAAQRFGLFLP
jgi:hypothetical protein